MAMKAGEASRPRRSLLAGLTGLILAAAVGAAWLLAASAGRRVRAGREIIEEIRAGGLGKLWPREPRIDWYLIHNGPKPVGWRAAARARTEEGQFVGVDMDALPGVESLENWFLNADATEGRYVGVERAGGRRIGQTRITLADGQVEVFQYLPRVPPGIFRARSPAPENYLPEGMLELAVRRTAARRAEAQFKLVFNERPNPQGQVDYGTLRFRDVGAGRGGGRKVRISGRRMGKAFARDYEVDAGGGVGGVADGRGVRWVSASGEEVARLFPSAPERLRAHLPGAFRRGGP